ncbi:GerAB/ArcD/ProY family transporter [Natranaerobius trueperi]|uniref:Uncharacterized protein n=1 Tax=Natranaerobius trueperi TaxID=759412 RepID=A0A226C007_9FIRM|nr:endospore germination permease [Natranaerobius trueperi]OWZ83700.1 hypothetical protein CDO51_07035 [Natranaerobius trueperi]
MNKHEKRDISEFQWITLLLGMTVGVGVTTLPREVATEAGRDGWITILIATFCVLIYSYLCLYYARLFPDKTLAESSRKVLGKFLGSVLIIIYSLYAFALSGIVLRIFLEIAYVYLDITYSLIFSLILILPVVVYIARCGLATLSRFSELVLFFTAPLFVLFWVPISITEYLNILPVFEQGVTTPVLAIREPILAFLGIEIILVFFPYLNKQESATRLTSIAVMSAGFIYTSIFLVTLMMMGLKQLVLTYWPFIEYLKIIELVVVERVDTTFIHFWLIKIILVTSIKYFAATFSLAHLTNKNFHDKWALFSWVIILFVSLYPKNLAQASEIAEHISFYGGIFVLFTPIILIIVAKLRGVADV